MKKDEIKIQIRTEDYLFLQFKKIIVPLAEVCEIYYPHLSKKAIGEKASGQLFPFSCFKLDKSQKAPYFVNITEVAKVLDKSYQAQVDDHYKMHT